MRPKPTFIERRRVLHRPHAFSEDACHDYRSPGLALLPLLHRGAHADRLASVTGGLERAFAREWERLNEPPERYLALLLDDRPQTPQTTRYPQPVSQRDARVAATVVQWLGTNVGRAFLSRVLQGEGFESTRLHARTAPRRIKRRFRYDPAQP